MLNISVATAHKEEGLLKAFFIRILMERPSTRAGLGDEDEVSPSFSGWLSDIITAGPSLLFSPRVLSFFRTRRALSLSLALLLPLPRISSHSIVPFSPHGIAGPTRRDIGSIF